MATEESIIRLFCIGEDRLSPVKKRPDASLYDREMVTISLLFALRGGQDRPFSRWLAANMGTCFRRCPTGPVCCACCAGSTDTDEFLAAPSFVPVADTYGIALRHPRREGLRPQHVGKKGISNGRWIIGVNVGWLIKNAGKIVMWPWDTANVSDREFRDLALAYNHETIVLCDYGFRKRGASHENMLFCAKGTWNEWYMIETDFSWACMRCNTKKIYHRKASYIDARLGYLAALINCLLDIAPKKRSLAAFVV